MKNIYYLFCVLLLISCDSSKQSQINLDWIVGSWERTNDTEGRKTYERWSKTSDNLYKGFGFTLQNNDTIFKEELQILKIEDEWNYKVIGVNENPTFFRFTEIKDLSFKSFNPENEFPKNIEYDLEPFELIVKISDSDKSVFFHFKKM